MIAPDHRDDHESPRERAAEQRARVARLVRRVGADHIRHHRGLALPDLKARGDAREQTGVEERAKTLRELFRVHGGESTGGEVRI